MLAVAFVALCALAAVASAAGVVAPSRPLRPQPTAAHLAAAHGAAAHARPPVRSATHTATLDAHYTPIMAVSFAKQLTEATATPTD